MSDEGSSTDDEVTSINAIGDVKLPGEQPVECEFDQMQGAAGRGFILRLERLLVFLAVEPKPNMINVAFVTEVRHFLCRSVDRTRGG